MTKDEIRQVCNIGRGIPRRRPLMWVGKRNGKNLWMRNKSLPLKRLCEKYPDGVISPWRRNVLRILHSGRNSFSPWFSDVCDKLMKRFV